MLTNEAADRPPQPAGGPDVALGTAFNTRGMSNLPTISEALLRADVARAERNEKEASEKLAEARAALHKTIEDAANEEVQHLNDDIHHSIATCNHSNETATVW